MKERQTSETISACTQELDVEDNDKQELKKVIECQDDINDNDTGYVTSSNDSLDTEVSTTDEDDNEHEKSKINNFSNEGTFRIVNEAKHEMKKIPEEERREWLIQKFTKYYSTVMPKSLIEHWISFLFKGDSGTSIDEKPKWLDIDKFRRGQKLALDQTMGMFYANVLSLFAVFSIEDGLKPLIFTDASSTPYTSFKRYLSTAVRLQNWFKSDPWTSGTQAYNDIRVVRRTHAMVRKKIEETPLDVYADKTKIKEPWCPSLIQLREDLESTCPVAKPGQCPYTAAGTFPQIHEHKLSQGEMAATQFAFVGIHILYPKFFGMHDATDEDLEAYCHLWRGLGYLLGIDDDFNFCRGTLEEVRTRSREFLDYWVKPNLRVITPEWEHMMRCLIGGVEYYIPASTYETCLLDLAAMLNLQLPRTYNSLSYSLWIRHNIIRFYFDYGSKLSIFNKFMNRQVDAAIVRARNYDERKHQELKERSAKSMDSYLKKSKNNDLIFDWGTFAILMCTVILFFSVLLVW